MRAPRLLLASLRVRATSSSIRLCNRYWTASLLPTESGSTGPSCSPRALSSTLSDGPLKAVTEAVLAVFCPGCGVQLRKLGCLEGSNLFNGELGVRIGEGGTVVSEFSFDESDFHDVAPHFCRLTQLLTFVTQFMTQLDAIHDTSVANNSDLHPFILKFGRVIFLALLGVLF